MNIVAKVILLSIVLLVSAIFTYMFLWKIIDQGSFNTYVENLPNYVLIKQINPYLVNNVLLTAITICTIITLTCTFYIVKYFIQMYRSIEQIIC